MRMSAGCHDGRGRWAAIEGRVDRAGVGATAMGGSREPPTAFGGLRASVDRPAFWRRPAQPASAASRGHSPPVPAIQSAIRSQ